MRRDLRKDRTPKERSAWQFAYSHIEEIVALTSDYATAKAAYEAAVKQRPGRFITLRQKSRLIQSTRN